jgi:hypothetical protein
MKSKKPAVTAILGAALLTVSSVMAQQLGINFTGGNGLGGDSTWTLGYEFQVTSPVTVVGLATFDPSGLLHNVPVGLWTDSGALVASATVPISTPATGLFAEVSILPIVLPVGFYDVGSFDPHNAYGYGNGSFGSLTGLTVAPGITYVQDRYATQYTGFTYPGNSKIALGEIPPGTYAWFGGNIVVDGSSSVPDASSALGLLWGACLALGALRRKLA